MHYAGVEYLRGAVRDGTHEGYPAKISYGSLFTTAGWIGEAAHLCTPPRSQASALRSILALPERWGIPGD